MGRLTRRWFLPLCLLGSLSAHAASPVWAIRGDHNTVYLAGSVHLLKPGDAVLPPAFDHAYTDAKQLVLELAIDKIDPLEAASWMMQHGTLEPGTTLRSMIGEERYRRLGTEAGRLGVPMETLDPLQPWVIALQLLELQYAQLGFDAQQGVEEQLSHRAETDGKPIRGLETLPEQLGVLQEMSSADQSRFLDMVVTQMPDVASETQAVVAAWRSGDSARMAALLGDEYKSFPALYRTLVSDRNRRWVPQIEQLLHSGQDAFVIVGALHLVGDGGLLQLLQRDGYHPEALN